MGATIVNMDTENMGIIFTTSVQSDEDIEQACKEVKDYIKELISK